MGEICRTGKNGLKRCVHLCWFPEARVVGSQLQSICTLFGIILGFSNQYVLCLRLTARRRWHKRDKWKASLDWAPLERLSLQLMVEDGNHSSGCLADLKKP